MKFYSILEIFQRQPQHHHKESMQTSPLIFDNASYVFFNRTTMMDETQSIDTTIPFLDGSQQTPTSNKSHEVSSKSRTRNWSYISERQNPDNESTVTVSFYFECKYIN